MKKEGFALVELLVVITIIGILAALIFPLIDRSAVENDIQENILLLERTNPEISVEKTDLLPRDVTTVYRLEDPNGNDTLFFSTSKGDLSSVLWKKGSPEEGQFTCLKYGWELWVDEFQVIRDRLKKSQ